MATNKVMIAYSKRLIELARVVKDPYASVDDVVAMMHYCGIRSDDVSIHQVMKRQRPATPGIHG